MAIASWLAEFKILNGNQIPAFAQSLVTNVDLKNAIFKLFEDERQPEILDPVLHQLFSFYRYENIYLQRFSLEFLPAILHNYFISLYSRYVQQKSCASIEALLLGIYNIDTAKSQDENDLENNSPSSYLSIPSIYHSPPQVIISSQLTKTTLEKLQPGRHLLDTNSGLVHLESITNRNRLLVVSYSLRRYNSNVAHYSRLSYLVLCRLCNLLIKTFQEPPGSEQLNARDHHHHLFPWIPVDENFIEELLQAAYFIMFNGLPEEGYLALESLYFRAVYDLLPQSIMSIRAILNSLKSQDGDFHPLYAPRGQQLASSVKEAITNASFRPHLMPEDIEVKDADKDQTNASDETGMKARQKSVISKVFHIPMQKKKEEQEKKVTEEGFVVGSPHGRQQPVGLSLASHLSIAKKSLRNPFKSESAVVAASASTTASSPGDFFLKKETITISPYFTQNEESSETGVIETVSTGKHEKKLKVKSVGKMRKKNPKQTSSSTTSSPKHSFSVSSYLLKEAAPEKIDKAKSDIDGNDDDEDDDDVNEHDDLDPVDINDLCNDHKVKENRSDSNDAGILRHRHHGDKRPLFLRRITFTAHDDDTTTGSHHHFFHQLPPTHHHHHHHHHHHQSAFFRSDFEAPSADIDGKHVDVVQQPVPLLLRDDDIPRLPGTVKVTSGGNGNIIREGADDDGGIFCNDSDYDNLH